MAYTPNKNNLDAPLFLINGKKFPSNENVYFQNAVNNPGRDYTEQTEQLVRSTRNAKGEVVSQVINRRLNKFESLIWPYLSAESVTWLKNEIAKFDCTLTYWDSEAGGIITREYYWGDFEATPCEWELVPYNGTYMKKPKYYKNVKCNLIDKGKS